MIAAIYSRKSNEQEKGATGSSESVERQIEHASQFIALKGWTLGPIYSDDGVSGASYQKLVGRAKLISEAEAGAFQVLVVSEQSRLGRHMIESAARIMEISENGVRIWSYLDDQEIKVDDEIDQAMTVLRGFGAASERRQTSKRVYDSALRRVKAGQVAGSKIFGYVNFKTEGHSLRQIDPNQAEVVRGIFRDYANGVGTPTIALALNAAHVPAPRADGWKHSTIRGILLNEIYVGRVTWGKMRTVVKKGHQGVVVRPESEWQRQTAPELRIIDQPLWNAVQALHQRRSEAYTRRPSGHWLSRATWRDGVSKHLMSGFTSCGVCGGNVRITCRTHGVAKTGKRTVRSYVCTRFENGGTTVCTNSNLIRQVSMDQAVVDSLSTVLSSDVLNSAIDRALAQIQSRHDGVADHCAQLVKELAAIKGRQDRLVTAIGAGNDTLEPLLVALRAEEARKSALEGELAALGQEKKRPGVDSLKIKKDLLALASDIRSLLLGANVQSGRQMLRKLLDGKRVTVAPLTDGRKGVRFSGLLSIKRLIAGEVLTGGSLCSMVPTYSAASSPLELPFVGEVLAA